MKWPRKKRYTILFILWMGFVFVGLHLGFDLMLLNRELAAYRAEGYPLSTDELAEWAQLPEGTPNAAPLIEQAMDAINIEIVETHDVPFMGEVDYDFSAEPLSPDLMENIRIVLEANKETLILLHEASEHEHYSAIKEYDWVNNSPADNLVIFRDFVRLLRLESLYQGEIGDLESALDSIEAEYMMAHFTWQEPLLISWFMGKALNGTADASLKTLIQRESMSDTQLQRAIEITKTTTNSGKLDRMLIGERANMFDESFNNHNTIKDRWGHIDFLMVESSLPETLGDVWDNILELTQGIKDERNYLDFMQTIIPIGSIPPS